VSDAGQEGLSQPQPSSRSPLTRGIVGAALVLVGVGAMLVAVGVPSPARVRVVGGNLPVNTGATDPRDISAHNSPTLVRNPVDGTNLAVANRIDSPAFSCALHVSRDGGGSWAQTPLPVPAGEEPKCYSPDAAFGADGTLYVSFVTLQGRGNTPHAVWLATSGDGGRTLGTPVKITPLAPLAFQVRLVADPVVPKRLYVTWLQATETATLAFPRTGFPIQFARSDDGGASWLGPKQVSEPARERVVAPSLAAGPRGELYVAYLDLGDDRLDYEGAHQGRGGPAYPGPWHLVVARSTDRGATWAETVAQERLVPTERFVVFLPPFPALAIDARDGHVYAAFSDGAEGDADVLVWSSHDGGSSFGAPRRVNDTRRGDGTSQYLPRLAVAPNGRLDVVYYDRRGDPRNLLNEVSLQSSFDGGATFEPRANLSDRAFDSGIGFGSDRELADLGNRLGLLSTNGRAYGVWTDTRAGTRASSKQDLVRALAEVTPPRRLPRAADLALRAGGTAAAVAGLALLVSHVLGRRRQSGAGPASAAESLTQDTEGVLGGE